jgi:hypothetical protein
MPGVQVGGSIVAGTGPASGGITTDLSIGSVTVTGSVVGTTAEHAYIDAIGFLPSGVKSPKTDVAIKSVSIGGDLAYGDILGGQDGDQIGQSSYQNGSAQLGAIKIAGNFIGSNISAGFTATGENYGKDYAPIAASTIAGVNASIASVTISGQAIGATPLDTTNTVYGIVADVIGSVKVGSAKLPLILGAVGTGSLVPVGIAGDLFIVDTSLLS